MNTDEKILNALEALQADVTTLKTDTGKRFDGIEKRLDNTATKQDVAQVYTIVESLKAGQDDIREGIIRVEQKVDRIASDVKSHKERIENLEEQTHTPNPHKH